MCGQRLGDLEAARIVDERFKAILHRDFAANRNIVEGTSVTRNGLLLCSCCHTKYDKNVKTDPKVSQQPLGRSIQIDDKGVIHLLGKAKEVNYKNLNLQKVPWAHLIDKNKLYPNSATLKYAFDLKIAGKDKRCRELIQDILNEDSDDDSEPKLKVKKRRGGGEQTRNCDISGCQRAVFINDTDLELHLCDIHADVRESELDR